MQEEEGAGRGSEREKEEGARCRRRGYQREKVQEEGARLRRR